MSAAATQGWQIAMVVLNDVQPKTYDCVKQWGNQRLGLATQCVSFQALQRNSRKLRLCKKFLFIKNIFLIN